mgnify:FL=1|tara:strand:- start:128 stop:721 length:594 start_codon:yes stop_codon:yes gene_type:complete
MIFKLFIVLAHLQAIIIPIFMGIKSINKFNYIKNAKLISWGFVSLGLASMFEMIDHTQTEWIYIDHSSLFNWLFYSFLSIGLTFLSISVIENKNLILTNLLTCILAVSFYWIFGKSLTLVFQVLISIFLIINWQKKFKDWIFIAYPIFGIFLTTFLGIKLSLSANQIWHIFIGPSGTISVLAFYFVLKRSRKRFKEI